MNYLKQSTAGQAVVLGPFVDDTDGATAETALTIANTDIKLSKNGGTMANKNSGGGTHDANGWYTITLDATDTATVGRLQVSCKVAGALPVFQEFTVLEETIYDALFGAAATGALPVSDKTGFSLSASGLSAISTWTVAITGNITGNLSGSVGSVTGAVGSVTGNVGGNVSGSVASVAGNVTGNVVGSVGSISGVTFPANFGSLVISVAGAADSLVQGYLNTTLTETNAGDIADSFSFFWDVDPTTTKTVDDVGAGAGGGFWSSTEQQQIRYRLGIDGTESAPVTNTDQNLTVDLNASQTGVTIGAVSGAVGSVTGAVGSVTGNVGGNVVGSVASVTGAVGSVTGAVGSVTGNVGGNVTGSVGSISGVTFPTNFGSMLINVSGHISRVTLVDTTTANTDMRGTNSAYTGTPPTAGAISTQVASDLAAAHGVGSWAAADVSGLATTANLDTKLSAARLQVLDDWINGGRLDLIIDELTTQGDTNATSLGTLLDYGGWILAGTYGAISNAGGVTETYVLTIGGFTYTGQNSGLDASGNRTGQSLTKV